MADLQDIQNLIFDSDKIDVKLKNRIVYKAIDEVWLSKIEEALPALDKSIRKPTRYIKESERVLNIEQSKNITARSIRDLAVHSDYIKKIDENGDIIPSKILNVFRDETIDTYENRFLNTLIVKLYEFIKKRYDKLSNMTVDSKTTIFNFGGEFNYNGNVGKTNISIEIENDKLKEDSETEGHASTRVRKVYYATLDYMNGEFCKNLGKSYVRPPIVRTNALLKNPDLRTCLALWEFIEGYEDVGYEALINEQEETCSSELLDKMLCSIKQQCALFDELINGTEFETENQSSSKVKPKFIKEQITRKDSEFDIRDSEYKSIVEIVDNVLHDKEQTDTEKDIDLAIQLALELANKKEEKAFEKLKNKGKIDNSPMWFDNLTRINRSYLSRLIQFIDDQKDLYFQVRNHLLQYNKVKNRISWHRELFYIGRKKIASFAVRGKTLCINLALDPKTIDNKYHFIDESEKESKKDMPLLMKIRSQRAVKYTCELIDQIMNELGISLTDKKIEKMSIPYQTDEELLNAGLIKLENKKSNAESYDNFFVKENCNEENGGIEEKSWFSDLARINRSFTARITQIKEESKGYYSEIKNTLLGYKKIKDRISWNHDLFYLGRKKVAKMVVRGKTLCLYLALDPSNLDSKYHVVDLGDSDSKKDLPLLLKVRSQRAVKYAKELIAILMEELSVVAIEREAENYILPYKTDKQLFDMGLIKIEDKVIKQQTEENSTIEEENTENSIDKLENLEENSNEEISSIEEKSWFSDLARINRSFTARITQIKEESKGYYSEIKNTLLGYKKIKDRISWNHDLFYLGRKKVAKMVVRGKTLCLYLALDPSNLDSKYHVVDLGASDSKKDLPLLLKVRSQRAVKYAKELIAILMEELSVVAIERETENYILPYKTDKQLFDMGLIKVTENINNDNSVTNGIDKNTADEETLEENQSEKSIDAVVENETSNERLQEIATTDVSENQLTKENADLEEKSEKMEQEEISSQNIEHNISFSDYPEILKHFKQEEIIALISKIKKGTATSIFEQVEEEVLMCYKLISTMGFFKRRKYAKIFRGNDLELISQTKAKLLAIYMKEFQD